MLLQWYLLCLLFHSRLGNFCVCQDKLTRSNNFTLSGAASLMPECGVVVAACWAQNFSGEHFLYPGAFVALLYGLDQSVLQDSMWPWVWTILSPAVGTTQQLICIAVYVHFLKLLSFSLIRLFDNCIKLFKIHGLSGFVSLVKLKNQISLSYW